MEGKKKTFKALYEEQRARPTAAQLFVHEMAALTHRSEVTVKMWLTGRQVPDGLAQATMAEHFGTTAEALFPAAN